MRAAQYTHVHKYTSTHVHMYTSTHVHNVDNVGALTSFVHANVQHCGDARSVHPASLDHVQSSVRPKYVVQTEGEAGRDGIVRH